MFRERLFELRSAKGVTQADIANAIGVSPATIGNYEQGTRVPRNQEVWNKLAEYFEVSVDYLQEKTDISYNKKQTNTRLATEASQASRDPLFPYIQYRKDVPIFFMGCNITPFVFADYYEEFEITSEQMTAFLSFESQSNHVLFARRMLLTILYDIKNKTKEEILSNLDKIIEKIEDHVICWFKRCWFDIDNYLPKADSLESLHELLLGCLAIDKVAQKQYTLVPLDDDFHWLHEKLC